MMLFKKLKIAALVLTCVATILAATSTYAANKPYKTDTIGCETIYDFSHDTYMRGCEIVNMYDDAMIITVRTSTGVYYDYEDDSEDLAIGDIMCCLFDDNGTPDYIYDDAIIDAEYSGYYK